MKTTIRIYEPKDSSAVAVLHRLVLPKGFLSTLGNDFLRRLYGLLAASPHTVVWVGVDGEDQCVGFVSGTLDIRACYREVLRRGWWSLALGILPSLISPRVWLRILETMAYPLRRSQGVHASGEKHGETGSIPKAELLSIAISDRAQGQGLGRRLVASLEEFFQSWGDQESYKVVTDANDPQSNAFYKALGFVRIDTFRHHEHEMSRYIKSISAGPSIAKERQPDV